MWFYHTLFNGVMGAFFETLNQLNQMIHCFKVLESQHAEDVCWLKMTKCNESAGKCVQQCSIKHLKI